MNEDNNKKVSTVIANNNNKFSNTSNNFTKGIKIETVKHQETDMNEKKPS